MKDLSRTSSYAVVERELEDNEERKKAMEIGPLEYVVIGFKEHYFTDEILPLFTGE